MSEIGTSEGASVESEKPVPEYHIIKFPPFPEPRDEDFDEDLLDEEKSFYKQKFPDLNEIVNVRLHCTACDRHLGCSAQNETRMRPHPMLRTLICHTCHSFYNSGEFDKGEDGSELYCRWCGQGGQVYCCSDCVHVFCAKCIKRNMGVAKIKEIENTDDWKCFKCNPKSLWELRALCWALLRYCDLRNKIVFLTQDPELKEKYQTAIAIDTSECCKHKSRRREKTDIAKKKEKEQKEAEIKRIIPKLPATIQVKKFASINLDETPKKNLKRPASPKIKPGYIQKPISIAPCTLTTPPILKKIRLPTTPTMMTPVRFMNETKKFPNTYTRLPPRPPRPFPITMNKSAFNGLTNPFSVNMPSIMGDNLNLSIETLTQGLDMSAVVAYNNAPALDNDSVVCTPDFPLEPLCEVTEENDDDVECITPGPVAPPKTNNPPPLVPRSLPDISNENIVQMTENDVTVNALTGGLKFRVDPQTLSSKKMYRLPDGRIFAINPNPSMPGGYSATIVSVSDGPNKGAPKGNEVYAAKLSAVKSSQVQNSKRSRNSNSSRKTKPNVTTRSSKMQKTKAASKEIRECDLKVPVEWYRYNLIDAVDALDYSLSRLNKLKKETTTAHLRTRTIDEIKYLHRTLEQLLTTSSKRFLEIRDSLNKELKQYVTRKTQANSEVVSEDDDDDDDDVEFLPNAGNDDPIFIDENSVDSVNDNDSQEVDLTGAASSEHNDSAESKNASDPLLCSKNYHSADKDNDLQNATEDQNESTASVTPLLNILLTGDNVANKHSANISKNEDGELDDKDDTDYEDTCNAETDDKQDDESNNKQDNDECDNESIDKNDDESNDKLDDDSNFKHDEESNDQQDEESNEKLDPKSSSKSKVKSLDDINDTGSDTDNERNPSPKAKSGQRVTEINGDNKNVNHNDEERMDVDDDDQCVMKAKSDKSVEQSHDTDMSEEMIENLLKDDALDVVDNDLNTNRLGIPGEMQEKS